MPQNLILFPLLLQVVLTLAVYFALTRAKQKAIAAGEVDQNRRALHDDAWPDYVQKINNNLRNQFESPLLFYVVVFVLWELNGVDVLSLGAAWLYVLSRILHAWVHTGSNYVPLRKRVFVVSVILLVVLTCQAFFALIGSL
jgi:hypothetical protein